MKRMFVQLATLLLTGLVFGAPAAAYDQSMADRFGQMFASVQGAKAGKGLHLIAPEQFVKEVRGGKQFVTVDIRTPGETRFFTGNLPGHLVIPLNELFKQDQLAKLPTDKPIVLLCHSGTRATAAATALRQTGFKETYVLKGGFKALTAYLGAKEANQPLEPRTAAR
jgi:rhodanese-related sulfurtransferase